MTDRIPWWAACDAVRALLEVDDLDPWLAAPMRMISPTRVEVRLDDAVLAFTVETVEGWAAVIPGSGPVRRRLGKTPLRGPDGRVARPPW